MWYYRHMQDVGTKRCGKCRDIKPLSAFSKSSRAKDGLQAQCKQCAAAYFQANRATIIPQIRVRVARVKVEVRQAVWDYLLTHPCVDCGESDPVVLEFDHVRGEKRDAVQELVGDGHTLRIVMAEIAKCDVRCANCHRRKTAAQLGWYREQRAAYEQQASLAQLESAAAF
jgi:hypothetical protein